MNIIVTGSNGFIGKWLINELHREGKHEITALIRKGSSWNGLSEKQGLSIVEVDYQQESTGKLFSNHDVCIHLIGMMGKYGNHDEMYEKINVGLTSKILFWCEQSGIKQFIFCSTPGVQGFGHRLAVETDSYAPRNYYEESKAHAEETVINFCKNKSIKYTIIRPDFVYGPGDVRRVKMYRNIKQRKFVLTTSGKSYLHPTYILDVIQGFVKSIGNPGAHNQIFNISAPDDVTSLEYLNAIADCVGVKLLHINISYRLSSLIASAIEFFCEKILKREAFVSKNKIDFLAIDHSTSNVKARQMIGYKPTFSIQQGMKPTIDWCIDKKLL